MFDELNAAIVMAVLEELYGKYKQIIGPDIDAGIDKLKPDLGWVIGEFVRDTTYEDALHALLDWHLDWSVIDRKIKAAGLPELEVLFPDEQMERTTDVWDGPFVLWVSHFFFDEDYFEEIYHGLEYDQWEDEERQRTEDWLGGQL